MDCIRVSQNLDDYLDGEIGPFRRQAIARHLDACPACSAGYTFEVQVRQTLWEKCRDEAPSALRQRILESLASESLHDETDRPGFGGAPAGPFK